MQNGQIVMYRSSDFTCCSRCRCNDCLDKVFAGCTKINDDGSVAVATDTMCIT